MRHFLDVPTPMCFVVHIKVMFSIVQRLEHNDILSDVMKNPFVRSVFEARARDDDACYCITGINMSSLVTFSHAFDHDDCPIEGSQSLDQRRVGHIGVEVLVF